MELRNMTSIYILNKDRILMMYRIGSRVFNGALWCGVGGHFEPSEINNPESCVLRELQEETGILSTDITNLRLKYVTIRKTSSEIRLQYIYFAELLSQDISLLPCDEGELFWIPLSELFERKMSFSNTECLKHYFEVKDNYNSVFVGAIDSVNDTPIVTWTRLKEFSTNY